MNFKRYSRQTVLKEIGINGQIILGQSRVAVVGCGALGTYMASLLVRGGIGEVVVIDRDIVELNNLQRQTLFSEEDTGKPKVVAASEKLRIINSEITVIPVLKDLNSGNIAELLKGADLIMDATDNFRTRYLINDYSCSTGVPWIYSGVIGTDGIVAFFPGKGPCLRCLVEDIPAPGETPTCESAGIVNTLPAIIPGFAVTAVYRYLIDGEHSDKLVSLNPWDNEVNMLKLDKSDNCLCCGEGNYEFLNREKGDLVLSLCEKGVQIIPGVSADIDLRTISARIAWDNNNYQISDYMLRGTFEGVTISLFSDGRAIIKGLGDEGAAESFYSRIIGL